MSEPTKESDSSSGTQTWTVGAVFASIGLFALAGVAEVGGGWLVWQAVRNSKPWWYVLAVNDDKRMPASMRMHMMRALVANLVVLLSPAGRCWRCTDR
jgi:drug/metabolite transporter superfamily protein YnfA